MIKILKVCGDGVSHLGVRQDKIRRYLHINEYGIVVDFTEDEQTFLMTMYVRNLNCDCLGELEKEFPDYYFLVEE